MYLKTSSMKFCPLIHLYHIHQQGRFLRPITELCHPTLLPCPAIHSHHDASSLCLVSCQRSLSLLRPIIPSLHHHDSSSLCLVSCQQGHIPLLAIHQYQQTRPPYPAIHSCQQDHIPPLAI